MSYRTIVVDPPWPMQKITRDVRPNQTKALSYPTMSIDEIKRLPIRGMADADSHLYLWTTHKQLPCAFGVVEAWGFRYECLFTWVKPVGFTPFSWMRSTEFALFCRRGSLPLKVLGKRLDLCAGVTRQHSRKPEAFLDIVEQVSPGPYLELFARRNRLGWDTWGDEALEHVSIGAARGVSH